VKKFQVKLVAEKFIVVSAHSEDELLKKLEDMPTKELRDLAGYPEWEPDNVSDMPEELESQVVLHEGKFWSVS
jgi:hypothetical protein